MESTLMVLGHYITNLVGEAGYGAIFILMLLESAFIPIPSEITMPFAGFLASQGKLNFWMVVLVGGIANLCGSLIVYYIGFYGKEKANAWAKRYGKYVLLNIHEVEKTEKWFKEHGEIIAFFSRLLPF